MLADAESWPHWATVITKVTWTSPEPRGVGTTRTVEHARRHRRRRGISSRGSRSPAHGLSLQRQRRPTAIAAFAEDYRVVATADGCHLTWVMAMKPNGLAGTLGMSIGRPVMAWLFQRFLHNLRRYTDARFGARHVSTAPPTPSAGRRRGRRR